MFCACGCGKKTNIAKYTKRKHGWIRGLPVRFVKGHSRKNTQYETVPAEERFWKYVTKTEGCWPWTGAKHYFGYGVFLFKKRNMGAHRASWLIHRGSIPSGISVLHKCDNPSCVNPDHLFLGTQADNIRDCHKKGRMSGFFLKRQPQRFIGDFDGLGVA